MLIAGICRIARHARSDLKKVAITLHYGANSSVRSLGKILREK